ncbi:MAG: hypothetical protein ACREME_05380 [Gemmatimonadales bacterium]
MATTLTESEVTPRRAQATLAAQIMRQESVFWGLPDAQRPALKWFTDRSHCVGQFDADINTVWLWAGLEGEDLVRVVGHEMQHAADWHGGRLFTEHGARLAEESAIKRHRGRSNDAA